MEAVPAVLAKAAAGGAASLSVSAPFAGWPAAPAAMEVAAAKRAAFDLTGMLAPAAAFAGTLAGSVLPAVFGLPFLGGAADGAALAGFLLLEAGAALPARGCCCSLLLAFAAFALALPAASPGSCSQAQQSDEHLARTVYTSA